MFENKSSLDIIKIYFQLFSIIMFIYNYVNRVTHEVICDLTDDWCDAVTKYHNSKLIANMFSYDGNLIGTVSQVEKKGRNIKLYFDYFANLPNIRILYKKYNISKVTKDVFINTVLVTWYWDGLEKPIMERIIFIFKDKKIFQLHSSMLSELN